MLLYHNDMTGKFLYSLIKVRRLPWQRILEGSRMLIGFLSKIPLIILDGLTKEMSIASYLIGKRIIKLGRKSGWLFVALYLKQCAVSLMLWRGNTRPLPVDMSVPVSLTGCRLPRIIPSFHRSEIRRRSPKGDVLIQFSF